MTYPIVIVGGFLNDPSRYQQFGLALVRVSGCPVFVAPISFSDWLWATLQDDFSGLLRRLAGTVTSVIRQTGAERLTLVAHSVGGVLARMYLGEEPYGTNSLAYAGHRRVAMLLTIGAPHLSEYGGRQAGLNQVRWVMGHYPGAFWPDVEYVTIMGATVQGRQNGTLAERMAFASYRLFDGNGNQPGDGIVPLRYGLLEGARQIVLPDIAHGPRALRPWYGANEAVIARWWGQENA